MEQEEEHKNVESATKENRRWRVGVSYNPFDIPSEWNLQKPKKNLTKTKLFAIIDKEIKKLSEETPPTWGYQKQFIVSILESIKEQLKDCENV